MNFYEFAYILKYKEREKIYFIGRKKMDQFRELALQITGQKLLDNFITTYAKKYGRRPAREWVNYEHGTPTCVTYSYKKEMQRFYLSKRNIKTIIDTFQGIDLTK